MKIRLLEHLVERLDNDLSRRKRELAALHATVNRNQNVAHRSLIRAAITMTYAHWEGFIKVAAMSYVSYVDGQGISVHKLSANFAALALRTELIACGPPKPSVHTAFVVRLRDAAEETIPLAHEAVDTRDNLRAEVFREIVTLLGLAYDRYATKEHFIDRRVCDTRNQIAHGSLVDVEPAEYQEVHEGVLALMDMFHDDVLNAATTDAFRSK